MNHQQEIHQPNDTHLWEFYLSQYVVMLVICHDVASVGSNSAVNKLVVIRVGCNQSEVIIRRYECHVLAFSYCIENIVSSIFARQPLQYFSILIQDFISDTKGVFALEHREPYREIRAVFRDDLNKAVGIENYSHTHLCLMFFGFLLAKPLMKVHLIDFVKPLLIKDSFIPEFVEMVVQLLCIVVADDRLQLTKFLFTSIAFEHPQQMELNGVEYCRFHNHSQFHAAKISIKAETAKFYPIIFDKRPWFHHVTPSNYVVNPAGSPSARLAAYMSGASLKNERDFKRKLM